MLARKGLFRPGVHCNTELHDESAAAPKIQPRVIAEPFAAKYYRSYAELVRGLLDLVGIAQKEIFLASKYYEPVISAKLLQKFAGGVALHILDGNSSGISFEERIRQVAAVDTTNRALLLKLLDSPTVEIKTAEVPFSFIVVDGKHCGFEVVDPMNPDEFYFAIRVEDSSIASKLIESFHQLINHPRRQRVLEHSEGR